MSRRRSNPPQKPTRKRRRELLIVFVVAAVVRLVVAASLWNLPLVRTPKLDSYELFAWAQRLAAGDWTWPAVAQHGPGYPMFLALLLSLGGGSLKAAMAMQAFVGAGTAVLVAATARRWFGIRAGLFAGLAYAIYGPAAYVDTAVLAEGLLMFLLAAALWTAGRDPLDVRGAAVCGVALGLAALVRPTALVIAAAFLMWMLLRRRLALAAVAGIVVAATIAPAVAKSWSTSGTLSIQGYGGLNAYIGNAPTHDGRATFRLGAGWDALNSEAPRAGIKDAAAQDRYYLAKTFREIAAQPLAFGRLLAAKFLWMVQSEEARDSHSYYYFTDQSVVLRVLPRWWMLFAVAAIGFGGIVRTWPRGELLVWYLAASALGVVLLVVGFRYRMPIVLAMAIAAGAGIDGVAAAYRERRDRDLMTAAAVFVAAMAASLALHDPRNVNLAEEWAFTGSALVTERHLDEAEAAYRHALELDPQSGLAWDGLGLTFFNRRRLSDARAAFDRAKAIDRDNARAIYHSALVDEQEGRVAQAAEGYQQALDRSPFDAEITHSLAGARHKLAVELGMNGHTAEARAAMRHVVELDPADGEAWLDLCLLSIDLRDLRTAEEAFQRARERGASAERIQFAAEALARAGR